MVTMASAAPRISDPMQRATRNGHSRCPQRLVPWVWVAVLCALHVPAWANDDAPSVQTRLQYRPGSDDCPTKEVLRAGVVARLGRDPFVEAGPVFEVVIELVGDELVARLSSVGPDGAAQGARVMRAQQGGCVELAEAVALAIAIAIDPLALTRAPATTPGTTPASTTLPPDHAASSLSTTANLPPAHSRVPTPVPVRLSGGGELHTAVGAAPSLALGIGLWGRVRRDIWSAALEGRLDFTSSTNTDAGELRAAPLLASVVGCVHFGPAVGCAVGGVGILYGSLGGLLDSKSFSALHAVAGLRGAWELPLDPAFVQLRVDVQFALTRTSIEVSGQSLWRNDPLSVVIGVAVGYQ